jgi:endonuclease YncB( thermonuclease family)
VTKKLVAALALATLSGTGFWAVKSGKIALPLPYYTVLRVIDGDTFVTKENQYVRLSSTYAPELEDCGGPEAKIQLEKLILNKPVYFKVVYRDTYQRFVSYVYTPEGSVNAHMLSGGFAYYINKGNEDDQGLFASEKTAKAKKFGIFSAKCTQKANLENPKCLIKGNNSANGRMYRYPGCTTYTSTLVQLYLGDRWFCTEKEAQNAGFTKSGDCPKP